jgi:O-antigen/teichoic acid export membrane protein
MRRVSTFHNKGSSRVTQTVAADSATSGDSALSSTTAVRVTHGSAVALVIFVASAGLAYCTQLAIARIVGADGYGQYAYVLAWMTVLAYLSALGFDVSLLRFIPAYRTQRNFGLMRGVLLYSQRIVVFAGSFIALLGAAFVVTRSGQLSPGLARTFLVGLALVPLWALSWVRSSIARAFGGVISALTPERIVRDALLLGLLALAARLLGWRLGAPAAMLATVTGSTVALCLVSVAARRLQSRELAWIEPIHATRTWLLTAAPLVVLGTVEPLMNRLGVVLLGWAGDIKSAGIYAVVFNVAFLAMLPRTAVNIVFAPRASELFARDDRSGLQALILRTSLLMLAASVCIALPLWFLASPILVWFGPAFARGTGALRILLLGQVTIAAAGSQLSLMTMSGHERRAAVLVTGSAAANVLVGAALIRAFGLIGAAIATTVSFLGWNLAMGLFVWRGLQLLPGVLASFAPQGSSRQSYT